VYVELHCHSAFSFLDGTSLPAELVGAAMEFGYAGMALTDHNTVSGSMEFAQAAKDFDFKTFHGSEIDLDDGRHLTLLVKNPRGWSNLCRLLTRAHAQTREEMTATPPKLKLEEVAEYSEGLICLSGCAARGVHDEASLRRLREAFGVSRLKVELQRPYLHGDAARNRALSLVADRLHLRTVATGNVHALTLERAHLQDAFVALATHQTLDSSEPDRRGNSSHILAGPQVMAARFADYPEAVMETRLIADQLEFDLCSDLGYRYPGAEDPGKMRELTELCNERLHQLYDPGWRRGMLGTPGAGGTTGMSERELFAEAQMRLQQELNLIRHHNLAAFFLIHYEMLELAREVAAEVRGGEAARLLTAAGVGGRHGAERTDQRARAALPPGRGRGSSVSSIVCYLTGLSHIDPIGNELAIGRFLSEDLQAFPDIDLDFPRDIRQVLIPRVHERFGSDHAALVAAFPTYRARGAIRELGKVLGLPPAQIERVARGSEGWDAAAVGKDIESAFHGALDAERRQASKGDGSLGGRWGWLARLSAAARGLPRHLSQHPGGMVVSTRPLIDCCPVVPSAMDGRYIAQWDKDSCGDAKFLKIDLLGLGMLSAVERCVEMITETRGEYVDLSRIPHDDKSTYDAIKSAQTTGVFQIESRAQMQSLLRTQPENLQDIAVQVAIVRPGPIQGGAVNPYIERRQRMRADKHYKIPYEHPSLERALKDTLGAIVFQDQVLEVSIDFAGFRAGQAEELRRAMSRKRSEDEIERHHHGFVEGAMSKHNVSEELAERIWLKIKGFAGFGFPKAHAAAFGLLAYQSTYLRVHYGPEFLCSLLNEQPMGFYAPDALVHEAQRRGITIHPPDVNRSLVLCSVENDGGVRIGLGYVRGAQAEPIEALVGERLRGGPFGSLSELASRAGAGRKMLELLAWAGACDSFAPRRVALWELGATTQPQRLGRRGVQLTLPLDLPDAPELRAMSKWETLLSDYQSTGLTAGEHPLALLRPRLPQNSVSSGGLERSRHGDRVAVAGLVVARQRPETASGVVFVLLEDEAGTINVIVPPAVYEQFRLAVRTEPLLVVEGKVEKLAAAGGAINVLAHKLSGISLPGAELAAVTKLVPIPEPPLESDNVDEIDDFRAVAPPVISFASGRRR
jgi:error-prone DNA polymerase